MSNLLVRRRFVSLLFLTLFLVGCSTGGGRPRVQGKVTLNGRPVGEKTLCFRSDGAEGEFFNHRIPIQPDGSFSAEVPVAGNYKLAIEESLAVMGGLPPPKDDPVIPARYKDATTSNLTWDVHNGENRKDFDLTD